jgi:hypothetical protein
VAGNWYYGIDENNNTFPIDMMELPKYFGVGLRRVGLDPVGEHKVSTVFLALNHNFGDDSDEPILFETMVRDGDDFLDFQERYSTWDEAIFGHLKVIKHIKKSLKSKKRATICGVISCFSSQLILITGIFDSWFFWKGVTMVLLSCWLICRNDLRPVI